MVALAGGLVQTLYRDGSPWFVISMWFVPATGLLRDVATTTSRGSRTGALVVDNLTGRAQQVAVVDNDTGQTLRSFSIGPTGAALTATQLAQQGVTTIQDLNGLSLQGI